MSRKLVAALLLTGALIAPASAQTLRVIDGDTIVLGTIHFRLHGIDAPETNQSCPDGFRAGHAATEHLNELIGHQGVSCQVLDHDRYGRAVAICRTDDGRNLNAQMVADGYAWAYTQYSRDYTREESAARAARLGVHAHDCRPAWEWRHAK